MATAVQNIDTAIANCAAQLADVTANPKPTYTAGGRTFNWTEYLKFLTDSMMALQVAKQAAGGPFVVRSIGRA